MNLIDFVAESNLIEGFLHHWYYQSLHATRWGAAPS